MVECVEWWCPLLCGPGVIKLNPPRIPEPDPLRSLSLSMVSRPVRVEIWAWIGLGLVGLVGLGRGLR